MKQLSDEELIAVIYNDLSERTPYEDESAFCKSNYFIGIGYQEDKSKIEGVQKWGEWDITSIAKPDVTEYGIPSSEIFIGVDWGFCQHGECCNCGFEVSSNMKHGICQICNEKVYMS